MVQILFSLRNMISNRPGKWLGTLIIILLVSVPASLILLEEESQAELSKMSSEELRDVRGQSLIDFTRTNNGTSSWTFTSTTTSTFKTTTHSGGLFGSGTNTNTMTNTFTMTMTISNQNVDFNRIELDGSLEFSGGLSETRLGFYDDSNFGCQDTGESYYSSCNNANGTNSADQSIDDIDLRANGDKTDDSVFNDPYVELAIRNQGTANQELVGLRVGLENLSGEMAFYLNQLSASIDANCTGALAGVACVLSGGRQEIHGHRVDNALANLGNIIGADTFIEFNGTEDFWFSFQKEDFIWHHKNPAVTGTPGQETGDLQFHTDGKGFWMHFTNDVDVRGPF